MKRDGLLIYEPAATTALEFLWAPFVDPALRNAGLGGDSSPGQVCH